MSRRFVELVVRARRLVARAPVSAATRAARGRLTARPEIGRELTQFSFRLALLVDLTYVGIGALGGAALGRATAPVDNHTAGCSAPATADPAQVAPRSPNDQLVAPADSSAAHIRHAPQPLIR